MIDPALTPLAVMVLGVLRERDMHPYEMVRLLTQRHADRVVPVSKGTLYHTVTRLERQGLVTEAGVDRDGNRPARTTYSLTDAGAAASADWIRRELPQIDRILEFRVALGSAHDLPRDEVIDGLTRRREALRNRLDDLDAAFTRLAARDVPLQFLVEKTRERAILSADLDWLDSFLVQLADPALPWGPDELPAETRQRLADFTESVLS